MRKARKKLKIVYTFDPTITNWQERLDSAFGLVFKKIEKMEMQKNGENIKHI